MISLYGQVRTETVAAREVRGGDMLVCVTSDAGEHVSFFEVGFLHDYVYEITLYAEDYRDETTITVAPEALFTRLRIDQH